MRIPLISVGLALLIGAVLFGGATRSGSSGDVILQLVAIPVLIASLWVWGPLHGSYRRDLTILWVVSAITAVIFAWQVVPLPDLISRSDSLDGLIAEGRSTGFGSESDWHPLSVSPDMTTLAALSVLPALAMFGITLTLSANDRSWLIAVLIGFAAVSMVLGLIQVYQGPDSELRFYEVTNRTEAVGFFANRNHFAALLYSALMFAVAGLADRSGLLHSGAPGDNAHVAPHGARHPAGVNSFVQVLLALAIIGVLAGLAMARSRAGLGLAVVGLTMFALLFVLRGGNRGDLTSMSASAVGSQRRAIMPVLGLIAFAFVFALSFGLDRLAGRFGDMPFHDLRIPIALTTLDIVSATFPFGTGAGTFAPVYGVFEKTQDVVPVYANRAHNDVLEVIVEFGVIGAAVMMAFSIWLIKALVEFGRGPERGVVVTGTSAATRLAALITIVLLCCHSIVDYPLRTTTLGVVFAFCCGLVVRQRDELEGRADGG
ncbi:MAG: O-antigen ligase family protein, partial [Pseudomonadota bacterium]